MAEEKAKGGRGKGKGKASGNRGRGRQDRTGSGAGRFEKIGDSASDVVQRAAAILEEELAAGVVSAQRIEEQFREERRVDEQEVDDVVERFRNTSHELVEMVGDRIVELGSKETQDLAKRFLKDAHGALDALANLAKFAPELVDRLDLANDDGEGGDGGKRPGRRKKRPAG